MDKPTDAEFTVIRGPDREELAPYEKRLRWLLMGAARVVAFQRSDEWRSRKRDVRWFLWGVIGLAVATEVVFETLKFLASLHSP